MGWTSVGEYADRVFKKVLPAETTEVYFYSQYLPVLEVGATYTLAFDIKAEGDFNRTEIYILSNKYSTNGALFNAQISGTTDEYQRAVIQFVPDSDYADLTDVRVRFDIDNTISTSTRGGATLWIKEPMMVKGNVAPESFLIPPDDIFEGISKAQAVADAITEKAASEGWATKLTYIDSTGIFTGQLSANTVTAIQINASQITAGTIDAARIDTVSLKSTLITASNINALTLDVMKGNIGGWAIASGSISAGNLVISSASKRVVVYSAAGSISSGQRTQIYYRWVLNSNFSLQNLGQESITS